MMIENLYNLILHNGITQYKSKNSKASLPARVQAEKMDKLSRKGVIFAVRDKGHFGQAGVKGFILTSQEGLLNNAADMTHWTPNVYRVGSYADENRLFIKGHTENNLQQINTFVVDIDTKKYTREDILIECMDNSIGLPTCIIESDRGYQVFFVLSSPLFISNKNDFRGLKVAKRISENIKHSLRNIEADPFCNDFGFARLPKADNIVYMDLNNIYDIATLMSWSARQDNDLERPLFIVPTSHSNVSVMDSEWFKALINTVNIKGNKGMLGRNNTLFTLALICYAEGWEINRTIDFLDEFNSRLNSPLKHGEVHTVINSAYSGKYNGPKKEYVEAILELHVKDGDKYTVSFGRKAWYKFKKEREERTRVHYSEWEQDIIAFVTANKADSEPFIWSTQKELCEALKIPQSTLNEVLKQSRILIRKVTGKGRGSRTGLSTVSMFISYALKQLNTAKVQYRQYVAELIYTRAVQLDSVGGYNILIDYLNELLSRIISPPETMQNLGGSG